MRTIGIIQARNGGDRLPNKGSIELLGKPMLQHVIERVKRAKRLDEIVVAMPGAPEDNVLLVIASVNLANSFCGRPYDIVDADLAKRYYICAREFKADLIVRICADNPCIEPEAIDLLIEHGNLGVDNALVTNAGDYRVAGKDFGWPDGIGAELYTMKMLEFLNFEVSKPELREHPHKYYHNTHNVIVPPCPKNWRYDMRLDVNDEIDFEFIEKIYEHFGNNDFHIVDVIKYFRLLDSHFLDLKAKMSGTNWKTGSVDFVGGKVFFFDDEGVVWYDAVNRIALDGWQAKLEPFEGPGYEGLPFDDPFVVAMRKTL